LEKRVTTYSHKSTIRDLRSSGLLRSE